MDTNKLYALCNRRGITVDRYALNESVSVSMNLNEKLYIGIDRGLTAAAERVCLAHELGHCETMSFYNLYSPFDVREKHELRANRWAIKKLVPESKYKKALKNGYDNVYSLAEYFDVTVDFMQKAVEYYKTA